MRTQPQAKRTITGEALHLPLAPLQNSGYGLKSLKRILPQKHLAHRLPSRAKASALLIPTSAARAHCVEQEQELQRHHRAKTVLASNLEVGPEVGPQCSVDPCMHGPKTCAIETPSAVNQLHREANPRSAAKTVNRCVIVNTHCVTACKNTASLKSQGSNGPGDPRRYPKDYHLTAHMLLQGSAWWSQARGRSKDARTLVCCGCLGHG
jgi:hypothetical protein